MAANIAIIAPFIALPGEPQASRFVDIAKQLSKAHAVELISSDFQHFQKRRRPSNAEASLPFPSKLLSEPGYTANISVKRLLSHQSWLGQLNTWLADHAREFDLIYCACPFTRLPKIVSSYTAAPIVADIQDLWPQSIVTRFLPKPVSRLGRGGLLAKHLLKPASGIIAVSKDYLDQVQCTAKRPGIVVPHGVDLSGLAAIEPKARNNRFRLIFVGTLGSNQILDQIIPHLPHACELVIVGDGPAFPKLEQIARQTGKNVILTGALEHKECLAWQKSADAALNAIHPNANIGATNKLAEFLACGLPVLSCQTLWPDPAWKRSPAFVTFNPAEPTHFLSSLERLKNNPLERTTRAKAARALAERKLDRQQGLEKIHRFCERILR